MGTKVKVVVMGYMNARVDGKIGEYGVSGTNSSGEHLVGMCAEQELLIGNTWFTKKEIDKYT
jgi:hypothetical protein